MQKTNQLVRELNTAIVRWYPFGEDKDITYIGDVDAVFEMLRERFGGKVKRVSVNSEIDGKSDYIICIKYAELLKDVSSFLCEIKKHLTPGGRLLLGLNNRLGIRYFCGDRDPYTERNFDGIEDYYRAYMNPGDQFTGRAYDKEQIEEMLDRAGFCERKFYSVFSDLDNASFIFAYGYEPNEELAIRIFPTYNSPETVFLEEERLYSELLKNGLFHRMANAFFIECPLDGSFSDALQITSSLDRGHENAVITIIHENDTVSKQAAFAEGEKNLQNIADNMEYLASRGISAVKGEYKNGIYTMPFIKAETGMVYLTRLLEEDPDLFLQRLDEFRDEIMKVSETFEGVYQFPEPENESEEQRQKRLREKKEVWEEEPLLLQKKAMPDMIPLNTFFADGRFVFYDQEFCMENYPIKAILYRMIVSVYGGSAKQQQVIPKEQIFGRYGIDTNDPDRFRYLAKIATGWLADLRKEKELSQYHEEVRKNINTINANRQRMNYSVDDYRRLFVDIFEHADSRKLFLFGTGVFARQFLSLYGRDYPVYAAIDNNEKRWGQKLYPTGYEPKGDQADDHVPECYHAGVDIVSPEVLKELRHGEYKVIICIKSYTSVMKQLEGMGITEFGIYDPAMAYPRKRYPVTRESLENLQNSSVKCEGGKKYHIGYIAGVFDLYHIGHLNMFRRAKEMCDYLIVGVVSDAGVFHNKRTEPFVPFEERIEMVRSCRYVDEAVEIPYMFGDTREAWKMHHFDVQFSGSDYVDDPKFEEYKDFLEKHGATLEFFPYTQSTSSTKLKELISRKLL